MFVYIYRVSQIQDNFLFHIVLISFIQLVSSNAGKNNFRMGGSLWTKVEQSIKADHVSKAFLSSGFDDHNGILKDRNISAHKRSLCDILPEIRRKL